MSVVPALSTYLTPVGHLVTKISGCASALLLPTTTTTTVNNMDDYLTRCSEKYNNILSHVAAQRNAITSAKSSLIKKKQNSETVSSW